MSNLTINLYSDTQTQPTSEMRATMAKAIVGDEQAGLDASVNKLCSMVAELLGKENALFLPSGTMCNLIATLVWCRSGDEIIADGSSHIRNSEAGGAAAIAGVTTSPLSGVNGIYTAEQVLAAVRTPSRYSPRTRMISIEQTANRGGGKIWSMDSIREVAEIASANALSLHMDGARLLNAVVASGISAHEYAEPFDSVWIDLSKGLGCPIGAVLTGSNNFIQDAWQWKHRLGGAMRQAGVVASAGIYALEYNVDRLADDHRNARLFSRQISDIPGIVVENEPVETNMVYIDVSGTGMSALQVSDRMDSLGVRLDHDNIARMRVVTHLDVGRKDVVEAAKLLRKVVCSG